IQQSTGACSLHSLPRLIVIAYLLRYPAISKTLSSATSGATVFRSFAEYIDSFGTFLIALSVGDSRPTRLGQVNIESLLEQFGRLKIWGDQTKADLPTRARGSLDDTLRYDNELRDMVLGILLRLKALLDITIPIAHRKFDECRASDQDSISSVSDESDSEDESSCEREHRTIPKIVFYIRLISTQIRSLYDISALLRRPTMSSKYIRSVKKADKKSQETENIMLKRAFSTYDHRHVIEKVRQWRGKTKCAREMDLEKEAPREADLEEDEASAEEVVAGQRKSAEMVEDCENILWLCQRLSEANIRRREQIEYWTGHPYDPRKDQAKAADPVAHILKTAPFILGEGVVETKNTAKPPVADLRPTQAVTVSGFSKQSFSTVAISELHETKTSARPRTVYTPTEAGQRKSTSVPNPPKVTEDSVSFTCPYCGTMLDTNVMRNRQSWKRHVFRDLRPYVCSFEHCSSASKLYVSRNDWMYHELQVHRRRYLCRQCNTDCPDRPSMQEHIKKHYQDALSLHQLSIVLDLCNHQASEAVEDACVICGRELLLSELLAHLAAHMEEIALFALPMTHPEDENERGGSYASRKAAESAAADSSDTSRPEDSRDNVDDGGVSLTFEDADRALKRDHTQTADDFKKLLVQRGDEDGEKGIYHWIADANGMNSDNHHDDSDEDASSQNAKDKVDGMVDMEMNKALGDEHSDTLTNMADLASTYRDQGRWEEAETLQIQVMEIRKKVLGDEHLDTLSSMANLASTYRDQSRWKEAETLQVQVMEMCKKVLGDEHLDTLSSMANLASTYRDQSRWKEAEILQVQVMEMCKKVLGDEHPDTLSSMANLASTYRDQGRWEEAETLQIQVMEI
ncbi:Tetratricopeptide repeat-domain-containing protein, partial [Triangularia verruculosa]